MNLCLAAGEISDMELLIIIRKSAANSQRDTSGFRDRDASASARLFMHSTGFLNYQRLI